MNILTFKVNDINPAEYNPRKDLQPGDPEYEKLKKSIMEFDLVEPLVWNRRTGNLVGGHQRLKILKELGVEETDVSVVDLPLEKEKAVNLALNKIQGVWDFPKLKDILGGLDVDILDLEVTGFDSAEREYLTFDLETLLIESDRILMGNYFNNLSHNTAYWAIGKIAGLVNYDLLQAVESKLNECMSDYISESDMLNDVLRFIYEKWQA